MENTISATCLNDFMFCPASIYFHKLYEGRDTMSFQSTDQINGTAAHQTIDTSTYSTSKHVLTGIDAYSERYGITCKIDIYDIETGVLTERKKRIQTIYDGYVFQLYAQYYSMCEIGYKVKKLRLHSMDDNRNYDVLLPEDNPEVLERFQRIIEEIILFDISSFKQINIAKCKRCIYEPACDRSLSEGN